MKIFKSHLLFLLIFYTCAIAQTKNEMLFEETRITLNNALDKNAQILSTSDFSKSSDHYKNAVNIYKRSGSPASVSIELEKSIALLTILNEDVEKSNEFFKTVLTTRQNSLKINSDKYSPYYWEKAEELFLDAIEEYNNHNYKDASSKINFVINYYSRADQNAWKFSELLFNWSPIKKADSSLAYLIAPKTYEKGLKFYSAALNGLSGNDEITVINKNISEAANYFLLSVNASVNFSKEHPGYRDKRNQARDAGSETYAPEYWAVAEELLTKAGNEFEDKDYDKAKKYVKDASAEYKLSKQFAVKERLLFTSRNKIKIAEENSADKYSPVSYDNSLKYYSQAEKLIDTDNYTEANIVSFAEQAELEADKANMITNIIKSVKDGKTTWENIILKSNLLDNSDKQFNRSQKTEIVKSTPSGTIPTRSSLKLIYDKFNLERYKEIDMEILEDEGKILLRVYNINFKPTGWRLNDESKSVLDQLIIALENFKAVQYQINSYTDNVGAQRMNNEISDLRAKTIQNYLTEHSSFLSNKMTAVGLGEGNSIADNKNYEGRKKNNRIEILISD